MLELYCRSLADENCFDQISEKRFCCFISPEDSYKDCNVQNINRAIVSKSF